MRIICSLLLMITADFVSAQTSLAIDIDGIYNFSPSKLSQQLQEEKMPSLDKFWGKVKADTARYLPQLRYELANKGHNPFFYFDGADLLLSLSTAQNDKQMAADAIARCHIDDIDRKIYVTTLNRLANDGVNVTAAAIKILSDDKYSFFIAQHALTFDQGYCLSYMLVPQKELNYIDTLASLFKTVSDTAQYAIATTLWFSAACKGDAFLRSVAEDNSVKKEVRDYIRKLVTNKGLMKEEEEMAKKLSKGDIKAMRVNSLRRFSDEAIEELDFTTRLLQRELKCN
jgi:hypothetical protein